MKSELRGSCSVSSWSGVMVPSSCTAADLFDILEYLSDQSCFLLKVLHRGVCTLTTQSIILRYAALPDTRTLSNLSCRSGGIVR